MEDSLKKKLEDRKAEVKGVFDSLSARHGEILGQIKALENEIMKIESSILRVQGAHDELEKLLSASEPKSEG